MEVCTTRLSPVVTSAASCAECERASAPRPTRRGLGRYVRSGQARRCSPRRLSLRSEVLEETEGGVAAGVVVSHLVGVQREALRADERDILHDQPFGQGETRVDGLLRDGVTDVFRLDLERIAGADAGQASLGVHLIPNIGRTMELREGLAEDRPGPTRPALNERAQRIALCGVGLLVDQRRRDAVAIGDSGRPVPVETET